MVQIVAPGNGQISGVCAAEVLSVPFYEILSDTAEKANHTIQQVFTQIVNGLHRQMDNERMSAELLLQSCEVNNQAYKAQVRMYVIFRMLASEPERFTVQQRLETLMNNFCGELSIHSYEFRQFRDDSDYSKLVMGIRSPTPRSVYAVTKKEKIYSLPMWNGVIYCNGTVTPNEDINPSLLTNTMTQHPGSLVSIQIIPTFYTNTERQVIEMTKNAISSYTTQLRFMRGPHMDPTLRTILEYYEYSAQFSQDPCFYYNFLVYSDYSGTSALSSKLIDQIEMISDDHELAMETLDVTGYIQDPADCFSVSPWVNSNVLIYQAREREFWNGQNSITVLQRLRYIANVREIRSVFKLPIDDGTTIGLESRRTQRTREKLNKSIMEKGSFRIGRLKEASQDYGGNDMIAGIPLNDFTKHGLIVGMPGSGKTNFSLGLLLMFWKEYHIPFLAIEPTKSEYRSLADAIPELQVFTPGKGDVSPFFINPFIPPDNVTVETYAPALMTAFKAAFDMPNPLPNVFQRAINEAYTRYGWRKLSTSSDEQAEFFGMYEFTRIFRDIASNLGYKGESKANIESAGVLRLVSLLEQNSNIYDSINTIPLGDLLSKPTVIELNAITDKEQKSLLMSMLLTMICVHTKNNTIGDGQLKNIILMDEAHVLLGRGSSPGEENSSATVETVEDMIAEIRSYGTGIIIADQTPTKVGKSIVANTNVKVIFKLVERDSRDMISVTTNMSQTEYDELGRLGVGEAMLHFGRVNSPLQIRTFNVNEIATMRQVIPDEDIARMSTYWDSPEHKLLMIQHRECKYCRTCQQDCDLAVRDLADYVAARIWSEQCKTFTDLKVFCQFLGKINTYIREILHNRSVSDPSGRLMNCTKVKFLRKAMMQLPFQINGKVLDQILQSKYFLNYMA